MEGPMQIWDAGYILFLKETALSVSGYICLRH